MKVLLTSLQTTQILAPWTVNISLFLNFFLRSMLLVCQRALSHIYFITTITKLQKATSITPEL